MPIETVAIGDCIVDMVEKDGAMVWCAGGAALNLAVGLARLSNISHLVMQIGQDRHGMRLLRYLREEGVKAVPARSVDYTGVATSTRLNGEPHYHFNAPMQRRYMMPDEHIAAILRQKPAIAMSSFAYDDAKQVHAFYTCLQDRLGKLFIDPNPRPNLVSDMAKFKQGFEHMATIADFVKLSDEDIELFYGKDACYIDIAAHLYHLGTKICFITLGERGASLYVEGKFIIQVDIWPDPRPIIDTMGAGDATLAIFINQIMRYGVGHDPQTWRQYIEAAMKGAAATCRTFGASLQLS